MVLYSSRVLNLYRLTRMRTLVISVRARSLSLTCTSGPWIMILRIAAMYQRAGMSVDTTVGRRACSMGNISPGEDHRWRAISAIPEESMAAT